MKDEEGCHPGFEREWPEVTTTETEAKTAMSVRIPGSILFVLSFALLSPLQAQDNSGRRNGGGLDLTVGGTGLAIGNIPRVNGIRLNFRDRYLEEVNGLNLTLWTPQKDHHVGGTVRGLAVGLISPVADRLQGLSVGGLAVVGSEEISGIALGGLAVVGEGTIQGIAIGGLATVADGSSYGINIGKE